MAASQQAAPRSAVSPAAAPTVDVFLSGLLFMDIVFTGLGHPPTPGTEVWTGGMATSPGGIANFAVALSRFGLRTSLAAAFGTDMHSDYCWHLLADVEGVDLSRSARFDGWPSPVTVSMAYDGDRALVTHGQPPPSSADTLIGEPPASRASVVHIGPEPSRWLSAASAAGSLVFADVGWDPSQQWTPALLDQVALCHAFMPNEYEAMSYTRTDSPGAALSKLGDLVPLAVITRGGGGAIAVDGTTGETATVLGLDVEPVDTTGAGDVFGASLVAATLAGWRLVERLRFANLAAALSVQRIGGALAAPGWKGVANWWLTARTDHSLRRDYAFLDDVIPADHNLF
ncbi:sugar/nucleoside kinase (ribokinase family) [Kibdelosporangium banguiense]|uniref:Sugar/nucleoside kinase (Ribokinase family) n=1 Tax=Kibdelosporangium banguiense TaxID=1365924 RepID=A0ABS4TQ15_9PSEU|nr:carbohydrate kinase family protein [Kibdelosporangium banguiense]MBP2326493.1 sugar/nucleoside kinase (ribokinase family) [Kibdelosporangium banguiense]